MKRLLILLTLLFVMPAFADVFRNDTFTEGSQTALESHTPDTGAAWQGEETAFSVAADGTVFRESQATTQGFAVGNDSLTEAHYFAEFKDIVLGGTASTDQASVVVRSNQANGAFHEATHYELSIRGDDGWRLGRVVPSYIHTALDTDHNYNSTNSIDGSTVIDLKLEVETIDASTVRLTASISLDGAGYSVVATEDDTSAARITTAGNVAFKLRGNATASEFNAEDFAGTDAAFTSSPALDSCDDEGCTFDFTTDIDATVHGILCTTNLAAPTGAQIVLGDCSDDSNASATCTEATTGTVADTCTLTPSEEPEAPVYDAHFIACPESGVCP